MKTDYKKPRTDQDAEWQQSGGTLSDKTARKEFDLTEAEIMCAIQSGLLQYRIGSVFGNPFFRLLRSEVEKMVKDKDGGTVLKVKKIKTEIRHVKTNMNKLHRQIRILEKCHATLQGDLDKMEQR